MWVGLGTITRKKAVKSSKSQASSEAMAIEQFKVALEPDADPALVNKTHP